AAAAAVAWVAAIFGVTFDITSPTATGTARLTDSLTRAGRSLSLKLDSAVRRSALVEKRSSRICHHILMPI
ncbi:MAG: hypothetical protein ACKPB9_28400, partial [Dolichospermum sp.]